MDGCICGVGLGLHLRWSWGVLVLASILTAGMAARFYDGIRRHSGKRMTWRTEIMLKGQWMSRMQ